MVPDFKTYYKALVIQAVWYWHDHKQSDQWSKLENPEINPHICGQMINKNTKTMQQERPGFTTKGTRKIGQSRAKE